MIKPAVLASRCGVLVVLAACSSSPNANDMGLGDGGAGDGGRFDGAPVVERFEVDPGGGLGVGGGQVTLSWTVTDADSVTIDQGVGAVDGAEVMVSVTESTVFTLTAGNERGTSEASSVAFVATAGPSNDFDLTAHSIENQIDDALAEGGIDEVTALRYKVFALHDDERLPPEYDAEGPIYGTAIMFELRHRFADLPGDVQTEMQPFLLPLEDPESWYSIRTESAQKGAKAESDPLPPFEGDRLVADGRVRLRWQASMSDGEKEFVNTFVAAALSRAYEELTELMGKTPVGDAGEPEVYPVYVISNPNSSTMGWTTTTEVMDKRWSTNIVIDILRVTNRATTSDEISILPSDLVAWVVAHELFHAIGARFRLDDPFGDSARWLHESTATWAAHHVYPDLNWEHRYAKHVVGLTDFSLDDVTNPFRPYGSYLFHLVATERAGGPELIRRFWEESESRPLWAAINEALGKRLVERYADFAAINWNTGPLRLHSEWDDLEEGVFTYSLAFNTVNVDLGGEPLVTIPIPIKDPGVRALSAQYHHLTFGDSNVRTVLLSNGFNYELGRGVPDDLIIEYDGNVFYVTNEVFTEIRARNTRTRLLVKNQGVWKGPYDITLAPFIAFCQDLPEERVEELVVIHANGNFEPGKRAPREPIGIEPTLLASNMACGGWSGSARGTATTTPAPGNPDFSLLEVSAVSLDDLFFSRDPIPIDELVRGADTTNLGQYLLSGYFSTYRFSLANAGAGWTTNYSSSSPGQSCEGGGHISLDETQLFGIMSTFNHSLPTDLNYRGHFIDVGPLVELEYEVTCDDGPGGGRSDDFSMSQDSGDEPIPVDNDGVTIRGRIDTTTQGGSAEHREVWTWDLATSAP